MLRAAKTLVLKTLRANDANAATSHRFPASIAPALVLELEATIERGELAEAERALGALVRSHSNDPTLQILLGRIALKRDDVEAATAHFENAVAIAPASAPAHVELARICEMRRQPERARAHYEAALAVVGPVPELHNNLGLTYLREGRLDDAERAFREALRLKPGFAAGSNNLGRVYSERNDYESAIECFRTALSVDPRYLAANVNIGLALAKLGELQEALEHFRACLRSSPQDLASLCALGHVEYELGLFSEARNHFDDALKLDPQCADAHFGLANVDLIEGELESGWGEYEWRTRLPKFARYYESVVPRWSGEDLRGKTLLVDAEQGYGDTFMFARFAAYPEGRGATVVLRCRNALVRLMQTCSGVACAIDIETHEPLDADFAVPLLSLPHVLKSSGGDIPGPIPYLRAIKEEGAAWLSQLRSATTLRVGLAWRGNALRAHQRGRVPLPSDYEPLAKASGVAFFNLDPGCTSTELASCPLPLTDLTGAIRDFADTAALINELDLVVSVDTSIAHLAGAMGKAVWVLHSGARDWRWEIAGQISPWYPTARLFRRRHSWKETLAGLALALEEVAASRIAQADR
ncbi:MAG: tetratricopeptide repeat protein [Burkholderiales bacterium]